MRTESRYVWCRKCHVLGNTVTGHCPRCKGLRFVEPAGDTVDDVKRWAASRSSAQNESAEAKGYYGRSTGTGVPTRFGVLTSYYVPPRADEAVTKMSEGTADWLAVKGRERLRRHGA